MKGLVWRIVYDTKQITIRICFIFILIYLACAISLIIIYKLFTPTYTESQLHWGEITITRVSWSDDALTLYDEYDYPYEISDARNNGGRSECAAQGDSE